MHFCILLDFLCELYYDARIHEHQTPPAWFGHQYNIWLGLKITDLLITQYSPVFFFSYFSQNNIFESP